jgi:Tol biopolymer transport system component
MFGTSLDGSKLVFGRMLGAEQGQLVLRDRGRGTETVLASHSVVREGSGSFWPQVAPDGARVIYRVNVDASANRQYLISSDGGAPRLLAASKAFSLASDWSADGKRVIGECFPVAKGACELFPDTDSAKLLFNDPRGGEVLAPSFSWDGRWVAFMLRRAGRTLIYAASVDEAGSVAGEDRWVRISPEDGDAGRPRFSPDGSSVFYHQIRGSVVRLVRQRIDASTRQPLGDPQPLAAILNIPQTVFNIALQYVVTVSKDRVFFNTAEIRSNVWMTKVE